MTLSKRCAELVSTTNDRKRPPCYGQDNQNASGKCFDKLIQDSLYLLSHRLLNAKASQNIHASAKVTLSLQEKFVTRGDGAETKD